MQTGLLNIYIKPESALAHGCDGALSDAGTPNERVTKNIIFPPPSVVLGRNPNPITLTLLNSGLLKGQYHTATESDHPQAGRSNLFEDRYPNSLNPTDYGKLYIRQVFKPGHCKFCWGPKHDARHCLYRTLCRVCLRVLADLPHGGFHHACGCLIQSTPKPAKDHNKSTKKSREGPAPVQPHQPSLGYLQRQALFSQVYEQSLKQAASAEASPPDL